MMYEREKCLFRMVGGAGLHHVGAVRRSQSTDSISWSTLSCMSALRAADGSRGAAPVRHRRSNRCCRAACRTALSCDGVSSEPDARACCRRARACEGVRGTESPAGGRSGAWLWRRSKPSSASRRGGAGIAKNVDWNGNRPKKQGP